jgi:hypothetical protein
VGGAIVDKYLDLVDEMQWEDVTDFLTLEEAGLENKDCDTVPSTQREYYTEEGDQ